MQVVHGGKGKGVGNLGAECQAHPAAFEIGGDEHGDVGRRLHGFDELRLIGEVGGEVAGDASGFQRGEAVQFGGVFAHRVEDEQLADLLGGCQAGLDRFDPSDGRVIEVEGGVAQKVGAVWHGVPHLVKMEASIGIEPIFTDLQSGA